MEIVINNGFNEMSNEEMQVLDGGLVLWGVVISGTLLLKVFGGGVTAGVAAAGVYYGTK